MIFFYGFAVSNRPQCPSYNFGYEREINTYVICWLGGPYGENCDRGLENTARDRRPRAAFFFFPKEPE